MVALLAWRDPETRQILIAILARCRMHTPQAHESWRHSIIQIGGAQGGEILEPVDIHGIGSRSPEVLEVARVERW